MEASFKILFTLGGFYIHASLFNHTTFQADLIWCDGTFKQRRNFSNM